MSDSITIDYTPRRIDRVTSEEGVRCEMRGQKEQIMASGEWSTTPIYRAYCETAGCDWRCEAQNAHGIAAQHARHHDHCTCVEKTKEYVYDHDPDSIYLSDD